MLSETGLPRARWYSLKRDVFGALGSGHYPGSLLLAIGFGRLDGQPVGGRTRSVSTSVIRRAPSEASGLSVSEVGLTEGKEKKMTEKEKQRRLRTLEDTVRKLESDISDAKIALMRLK